MPTDYSIKDSLYTFLSCDRLGSGLSIIAMEFSEFTSLFDHTFMWKLLFVLEDTQQAIALPLSYPGMLLEALPQLLSLQGTLL